MSRADDMEFRRTLPQLTPVQKKWAEVAERQRDSFTPDAIRHEGAQNSAAAKAALHPVLKAGLLKKCQLKQLMCRKCGVVARVVRTSVGLVITGTGPERTIHVEHLVGDVEYDHPEYGLGSTPWAYDWERTQLTSRVSFVAFVEDTQRLYHLQCRCRQWNPMTGAALTAPPSTKRGWVLLDE